jgi:hypothetical protein
VERGYGLYVLLHHFVFMISHYLQFFLVYILERSYWLLHLVIRNCSRYKTVMDIFVLNLYDTCRLCLITQNRVFTLPLLFVLSFLTFRYRGYACLLLWLIYCVCLMNQCYNRLAASQNISAAELQCSLKIVWYSSFKQIKILLYI